MDDLPDYALAEAAVPRRVWFVECLEQSTLLISMEDDDSGDVDITPPIAHKARCLLEAMEARIAKGAKARPSKTDESRAPASPTSVAKSRSSERLERAVALDGQINAPP